MPIFLPLQNKITDDNNPMLQEMRKFNYNFGKLQAELVVTKCVNIELCDNGTSVPDKCPVLMKRMFRGGWNISAT